MLFGVLLCQPLGLGHLVEIVISVVVGALFSGASTGIRKPVRYQFDGRTQPGSISCVKIVAGPRADEVELERLDEPLAHLDWVC